MNSRDITRKSRKISVTLTKHLCQQFHKETNFAHPEDVWDVSDEFILRF